MASGEQGAASAVDVVVVGFGAGGISAAITAHDAGAQVVVLEKMPRATAGGNTRVSGQVWFSPEDPALAKEYLLDLSCDMPVADDIADAWSQEVCRNTEWIAARAQEAAGHIEVDPADDFGQGTSFCQHTYQEAMRRMTGWETTRDEFPEFNNEGGTDYFYFSESQGYSRLWLRIKAALEVRGIEVRYETAATGLVQDEAGRVTGVRVSTPGGDEVIEARKGVVLASGGFENNPDMVRTYLGVSHITPWGSPANTGDGILMAQAVGANLGNMYQYMPFFGIRIPGRPTGEFVQPPGLGFIHVRQDGRRYIDETTGYRHGKSVLGGKLEFFPFRHATWTIFDEDVRVAGPLTLPRNRFAGGWLKQVDRYEWSEDNSAEIEQGWIQRGDTIRELAENLGVDPDGLEEEVARYNAFVEAGEDPVFGRPGAAMAPIRTGPFYGYQWGNLVINTMGGLRKNGRAQVLHVGGDPIPGLYCAGEISSTYTWALSGGQSIGDALTFGRIAGRNAAAS